MGVKRVVNTAFWTDGKVDDFTPEDKYFMLYLLTNPFSKQLGIYEISIKQTAFWLGYSVEAVNVLLDRFENTYNMIRFSKETNEVAILNFLRHSIMKGGKPVEDCIKQDIQKVKDKSLVDLVFRHLQQKNDLNATVKKVVIDYFADNDNKNDNDIHNDNHNDNESENDKENENDNDRTGDVSYHDTSTNRTTIRPRIVHESSPTPAQKGNSFGKYKNVCLTPQQLEELKAEFPVDWRDRIERLSVYMASSGKTYPNHLATIEKWAAEDEEKNAAKNKGASFNTDEFYQASLNRSYSEQPKTAAEDEELRKRGEELQQRLLQKKEGDTA